MVSDAKMILYLFVFLFAFIILASILYYISQHRRKKQEKATVWDNQGYTTTKQLSTLYIDDNKKCFYVVGCSRVYNYADINDVTTQKIHKSASTVIYLAINIYVNDTNCPLIPIVLINSEMKTNSFTYRMESSLAEQIIAQLKYMKNTKYLSETAAVTNNHNTQFQEQQYQKSDYSSYRNTYSSNTRFDLSYNKVEAAPIDYVVFDTETTGFDATKDALLEIGAIKYINNTESERFQTYIKTSKEIPAHITRINHITNDMVKDAPTARVALKNFLSFIGNLPLIAYNSDFDMRFIQYNCQNMLNTRVENDVIDALALARVYLYQLPNKKLETIKSYFNLNVGSHYALDDCFVTNHLYQYCRPKEVLKHQYGIPFNFGTRELTDTEESYVTEIINLCDKTGLKHNKLSLSANSKILSVNYDSQSFIGIKMYGKLQYIILYTPFSEFKNIYNTEIKCTESSKTEGDYTRVFITAPEQLSEFEDYFTARKKKKWSTT